MLETSWANAERASAGMATSPRQKSRRRMHPSHVWREPSPDGARAKSGLGSAQERKAMNHTTDFKSVRGAVSAAEWQTRVDLAACYRLMDRYGDDRPDLQPHHGAHPRHRSPADQSLRPALQGDHRVEPGEDRRRGQHHRQARHGLRDQQVRLRDPRRDPQGAAGRLLHHPYAYARRHGGLGDEMRAAADVADLDPLRGPHRLSRLRGAGGRPRRARAPGGGPRARTTR